MLGVVLFAIYLALDGYSHAHAPHVTLAHDVLTLLWSFNASAGLLVLGLFSNVYYKADLHRNNGYEQSPPPTR